MTTSGVFYRGASHRFTAIATASPPPMQRETMPMRALRRFMAWSNVTKVCDCADRMPSATAPPLTLTFSWGIESSFIAAIGTTLKASLISNRSMSETLSESWSRAWRLRRSGAVVNHSGSREAVA